MPRYFIELAYKGTNYAGFQKQNNANTIQAELEKALAIYYRTDFELTGSSRTDAGVHARQNFFHFDTMAFDDQPDLNKSAYHLNAILPADIVVKSVFKVEDQAHCRFDALFRRYEYRIYQQKDPFQQELAYHYPYKLNKDILIETSAELLNHTDFESFAKRNNQVFTHNCTIISSNWSFNSDHLIYTVQANRFLRGMVKGLVGTMLKAATKGHSLDHFRQIILSKNPSRAEFAVPSNGLTLMEVGFPAVRR
ncbi:MAG: tRNA pseudouridine(38-40) synthase TruA [Sphingobacteriales bacterium]|nr:MAG: tRNA pseudouridine(38-40) synthase TruA [Sphingobacteriales bacterium]